MRVNIEVFQCLDGIANRHKINDVQWATESSLRRPTISELRRMLRHPNIKIGRVCSIDKITHLFDGLRKIIGGAMLKKELEKCIEAAKDRRVQYLLYALMLPEASEDAQQAVLGTIKMAIQTIKQE